MAKKYLHELEPFREIMEAAAAHHNVPEYFVEKDYWIMHCLFSMQQQDFRFEMKGGTSLSKGFKIIRRFSEDLDIKIHPRPDQKVYVGKNHDKPKHMESRKVFFDSLAEDFKIPGLESVERDYSFDDQKIRNAGIRLHYPTLFSYPEKIKRGVLLEVGFAHTEPNKPLNFSSWAYDQATPHHSETVDNRAKGVKCYLPAYTFVEKLQAISHKFRQLRKTKEIPSNFMRHYYDIYELLNDESVKAFIGTEEYLNLKKDRFSHPIDVDIANNEAFKLSDPEQKKQLEAEYAQISGFFYDQQPSFDEILARIHKNFERL